MKKRMLSLALTLMMCLSLSVTAFAATEAYLTQVTVEDSILAGDVSFTMRGYVYYNSNTSTSLDIDSMAQTITNNGDVYITMASFEASDGTGSDSHYWLSDDLDNGGVAPGRSQRVEADWWTICEGYYGDDTVYAKNSSGNSEIFAYTQLIAGYGQSVQGGIDTYWYSNRRGSYTF